MHTHTFSTQSQNLRAGRGLGVTETDYYMADGKTEVQTGEIDLGLGPRSRLIPEASTSFLLVHYNAPFQM